MIAISRQRVGDAPCRACPDSFRWVLRRLSIGPSWADVVVPGWTGAAWEIARWSGRWLMRVGRGAWRPQQTPPGWHATTWSPNDESGWL